jgi:uncharacterized RDD family membrane protein YckC
VSQPDEILKIETPENVAFGYEVAGIGSRFLAALVDTFIIALIQIVVYAVLILIVSAALDGSGEDIGGTWLLAVGVLVSFVMLWGYYLFFELMWNGQTPGKRMVKLRVIRADGMPVTLSEVLIRNLVRLVDFLPISYGFGVIAMFVSKQSQRLGDLAAGTLVVFDQTDVSLESLKEHPILSRATPLSIAGTLPPLPTDLRVDRLTAQDIRLMEEYLARRYELANSRRMGLRLVEHIQQRLELPPNSQPLDRPDHWLMQVLDAYRGLNKPQQTKS